MTGPQDDDQAAGGAAGGTLAALRAPFPPEAIEQRPVVTCGACLAGNCVDHEAAQCSTCGRTVSEQHVHVPYLGHAVITERLNEVAPEWWWEPFALDAQGLPALTSTGGLWIKLHIPLTPGGLLVSARWATKVGYGSADPRSPHAIKEVIGDAIRNAAMRFGCGLELWKGGSVDQTVRPGRSGIPADATEPRAGYYSAISSISARRGRGSARMIVDHFEAWVRECAPDVPLGIGDADVPALERYIAAMLAEPVPT